VTHERPFYDLGVRLLPIIQPVNGGIVVFGGWQEWRVAAGTLGYRNDGAFLADDSSEWLRIPPNTTANPVEGNLLILKERDRIHFFGDRWNTFSLGNSRWEERPKDAGSLFAKMRIAADAGDQMIFWNPIARDGFAIRW
jgi:hypothetical protein